MAGIFVQLLLSWLIIWWYERNDLRVLGFRPTAARLRDFFFFLLITALLCASGFLFRMLWGGQQWKVNPNLTPALVWEGLRWTFQSVLFEELIFRGVLLYMLIDKLGVLRAVLFSATAFGLYHWFSFGVLGNLPQMLIVFVITGAMGLVYAFGYARTRSLYVPCAIHFGWNFTQGFVFSEGSIGTGLLTPEPPSPFRTDSYLLAFLFFLFPMLSAIGVNFLLIKRKRQADIALLKKIRPQPSPSL